MPSAEGRSTRRSTRPEVSHAMFVCPLQLDGGETGGGHLLAESLPLGFKLGQQDLGRLLQLLDFFWHFSNIRDRAGLHKQAIRCGGSLDERPDQPF